MELRKAAIRDALTVLLSTANDGGCHFLPPDPIELDRSNVKELQLPITFGAMTLMTGDTGEAGRLRDTELVAALTNAHFLHEFVDLAVHLALILSSTTPNNEPFTMEADTDDPGYTTAVDADCHTGSKSLPDMTLAMTRYVACVKDGAVLGFARAVYVHWLFSSSSAVAKRRAEVAAAAARAR